MPDDALLTQQSDSGLTHRATNDWREGMPHDVELTRDVGRCHHPAKRDLVPWPPGIECDVGPPERANQHATSLSSRDVLTTGGVKDKLAQVDATLQRTSTADNPGMPAFGSISGRASAPEIKFREGLVDSSR
jgi:hypothetical protein